MRVAHSKTGYFGVTHQPAARPQALPGAGVWLGGSYVRLSSFRTAEEAALCGARSQVGQVARRGGLPPTSLPLC